MIRTAEQIAAYRLRTQQLMAGPAKSVKGLVEYMGAIQAQDYAMAKWGIGIRIPGSADQQIERAIDNGSIIRTHVLRPTWHFVSAKDVRWMTALTAPHINSAAASMYKKLELNGPVFSRSHRIIEKALQGGQQLTREELMLVLKRSGINTDELRSAHLMFRAELDGIVCNGSRRGRQFTYALLDERVPAAKAMPREEAIAKLAHRYFTSHGPATMEDFRWWSGLPVRNARAGVEAIGAKLQSEKIGEQLYWFSPGIKIPKQAADAIHFLPAFDEYLISYKNRSAAIDPAFSKHAFTSNGIFRPVITVNGIVAGTWKRQIHKDKLIVDAQFFAPKTKLTKSKMEEALQPFAKFTGLELKLT